MTRNRDRRGPRQTAGTRTNRERYRETGWGGEEIVSQVETGATGRWPERDRIRDDERKIETVTRRERLRETDRDSDGDTEAEEGVERDREGDRGRDGER